MRAELLSALQATAIRVMSQSQLRRYLNDPEYHAAVKTAVYQAAVDFEKTVVPVIEEES